MEENSNTSNRLIYLAVFTGGMTTLAVELSASRLLGSVFGTSNLVWANVIGLILLYLTVGYFIGGIWADRSPYPRTLFRILIWGAFLSALIPLVSRPVLTMAADAVLDAEGAVVLGSFISILVLFSVPIILLGTVSPFAIRLSIKDPAEAGRISGRIYALSTVGSLIGTFTPVLIFIPLIGTMRTFLLFSGALYIVGLIGLISQVGPRALIWAWMPVVIGGITLWALNGPLRSPLDDAELLFEDETSYNYIQIQEDDEGYRLLYLNEGQGVHSIWHETDFVYNGTWDYFLAGPYFNNPPYRPQNVSSVLVIGLAAGTIPRQYIHVYGDFVSVDGIELDGGIVDAAAEYFDMNEEAMPNLNVIVGDGRFELSRLTSRYSVVAVDAYRPPYIPWHMTTVEFFQEIRDKLLPNGVVVVNVGRTDTDRRLVDAMARTMAAVYPSIHAIDVPNSFNTILVGTMQPTDSSNLSANLEFIPQSMDPVLGEVLTRAAENVVPVEYSDTVFIDDRAPVETLVDALVINFLLHGDTSQIADGR